MSKGPGTVQRAIAALIEAEPSGAWAYEELSGLIYGTTVTRAQKSAIGRALAANKRAAQVARTALRRAAPALRAHSDPRIIPLKRG
jgi:hypothetical protein